MTRTAREVVELYNLVVWNERDFALADELMGVQRVVDGRITEVWNCGHKQGVWE